MLVAKWNIDKEETKTNIKTVVMEVLVKTCPTLKQKIYVKYTAFSEPYRVTVRKKNNT